MQPSRLIQFYLGEAPDSSGRTIAEILDFTYQEQEAVHDYIQWLFPLREASAFNPRAPVLSQQDIATFRGSEVLRRQLLAAFKKMLAFYGFEIAWAEGDSPIFAAKTASSKKYVLSAAKIETVPGGRVVRSADWKERSGWLTPHNHNYLRITRILTCLGLLGLEDYARAFFAALEGVHQDYGGRIGPETWGFWTRAVPQHPVGGP
jgi:hypothetical protein